MSGAIPPLPNTPLWRGSQLKEHGDNFTFSIGEEAGSSLVTERDGSAFARSRTPAIRISCCVQKINSVSWS
jgi:hypothetical protein